VARAVAVGLINSVGNLGGFVGPYIVGYINTAAGSSLAGLAFLAGSAMTASVLLIVARGLLGGRGAGAAKP
jgi:nitrate/nitrite transporter NarK